MASAVVQLLHSRVGQKSVASNCIDLINPRGRAGKLKIEAPVVVSVLKCEDRVEKVISDVIRLLHPMKRKHSKRQML